LRRITLTSKTNRLFREEHPTGIVASADGKTYQVDAAAVDAQDEAMVRANFQRVLRPITGPVTVERVEQVRDCRICAA
jgi:hypothetical protein